MARLALEVPVKISVPGARTQFFAETRNVSAQGIFFRTEVNTFEVGQELECLLVLPEKLTQASKPSFVNCRGRIVRLTPGLTDNSIGVALEVNSFDFSVQNFSRSAYTTRERSLGFSRLRFPLCKHFHPAFCSKSSVN